MVRYRKNIYDYLYGANYENRGQNHQDSIQSSTTPDLGYQLESDNVTIRHHKREPRGQPLSSRRPQRINKQTRMNAQ